MPVSACFEHNRHLDRRTHRKRRDTDRLTCVYAGLPERSNEHGARPVDYDRLRRECSVASHVTGHFEHSCDLIQIAYRGRGSKSIECRNPRTLSGLLGGHITPHETSRAQSPFDKGQLAGREDKAAGTGGRNVITHRHGRRWNDEPRMSEALPNVAVRRTHRARRESASAFKSTIAPDICRVVSAACWLTWATSRIESTTWSDAVRCCCVAIEICLAASVVSSTC